MKALLLDIETAPNAGYFWGLFKQNIGIHAISKAGYTLCWAAKWLGENKTMYAGLDTGSEEEMLSEMWNLLDEADVVIHYNGKKFDIPTLNKEFVKMGWGPPSPYKQIDLLNTTRNKFRFASNKLDYVCQFLGLGGKTQHKGFELWDGCMAMDAKSWKVMQKYNKQDVTLLERLYNHLLPWIHNHPNRQIYDGACGCSVCGSHSVQSRGTYQVNSQTYQRYHCNDCLSWLRGSKPIGQPVSLRSAA